MKKPLLVTAASSVVLIFAGFAFVEISRLSKRVAALEVATSAFEVSIRDRAVRIQERLDEIEVRMTTASAQHAPKPIIDLSTRSIRDIPTPVSRF